MRNAPVNVQETLWNDNAKPLNPIAYIKADVDPKMIPEESHQS